MNAGSNTGARHVGVVTPEAQLSSGTANPRTVLNLVRAETFAVEWADDEGNKHVELMHRIGGLWHRAPNGENYAATLRPLNADSWLSKGLETKRREGMAALAPVTIPKDTSGIGTEEGP